MKNLFLLITLLCNLYAGAIEVPITKIDKKNNTLMVTTNKIDVGVSGFVVHHIADNHSVVVNNAVVISFDANKSEATLNIFFSKEFI